MLFRRPRWKSEWIDIGQFNPAQISKEFEYKGIRYELFGSYRQSTPWYFSIMKKNNYRQGSLRIGQSSEKITNMEQAHREAERVLREFLKENPDLDSFFVTYYY